VQYKYTSLGNIKSTTETGANGLPATTTFDYLASGEPASSEALGMVKKITDPIGRQVTINYDSMGRPSSMTDPVGRTTALTYNNYDQVTKVSSLGRDILMNYTVGGKSPSSVDYQVGGNSLTLGSISYDDEFSTNAIQSFGQTTNVAKTVDYGLKDVTNSNNVKMHAFTEDPSSKITTAKIGVGAGSTLWTAFYNSIGKVNRVLTPMTDAEVIDVPGANGVYQVTSTKTSQPSIFTNVTQIQSNFDTHNRTIGGSRTAGNIQQGGNSFYEYDANSFLSKEKFFGNTWDSNNEVTYINDDQGRVIKMTVLPGNTTQSLEYEYFYNAIGWVTNITTKLNGSPLPSFSASYEYDDAGRVVAVRTPELTTLYEYDNFDQITKILNLSADGMVDPAVSSAFKYQDPYNSTWHTIHSKFENITYDAMGNRTGMSFLVRLQFYGHSNFESGTIAYTYQNQRLVSESYTRTGHANVTLQHSYDSVGNLTMLRGATRTHDVNSDQLLSVPSFTPSPTTVSYDANGDITALRGLSLEFDSTQALTRLASVGSSSGSGGTGGSSESGVEDIGSEPSAPTYVGRTFSYDHNGLRRETNYDGNGFDQMFGYSGSSLVWQRKTSAGASPSELVFYLWGPTGPVLEYSQSMNEALGFSYDPQGNLVSRTSAYANTDMPVIYDGYGKSVWGGSAGGDLTPFKWKGQAGYVTDDYQSGLVYCWNRYYDPMIGRWISRDPIGLEGGINTYEYCGGNPIMYVDPEGLDFVIVIGGIAAKGQGHDLNISNFLRAAQAKVEQLNQLSPGEPVHILIYDKAYSHRWIQEGRSGDFRESALARFDGSSVHFIDSANAITSFIERQKTGSISKFIYYGHSDANAFMLDYGKDGTEMAYERWGGDSFLEKHKQLALESTC